jgi:cytidylate kinase
LFTTANLEIRAKRALKTDKYPNNTIDEIKEILIKREKDEVEMGKSLFGDDYDYRDPKHYHLTLNTGILKIGEEIEIINSLMV